MAGGEGLPDGVIERGKHRSILLEGLPFAYWKPRTWGVIGAQELLGLDSNQVQNRSPITTRFCRQNGRRLFQIN